MTRKSIWGGIAVFGLILVFIGGILSFVPIVGLSLMALGGLITLIAVIVLIPILIIERRDDNNEMRSEISEEELRP
jgi:hypothetical protein